MERVWMIALNTFRESIRSKILYLTLCFSTVLIFVAALFGSVTIGDQIKVIIDFGLFSTSILAVLYAVITGTTLLSKELTRKTIFNVLSKAVKRWEFVCGKYLGMLLTEAVLIAIMAVLLVLFVFLFQGGFRPAILLGSLHILFELVIVCGLAIFFSTIVVTPLLSGILAFSLFLVGRSAGYLLYFVKSGASDGVQSLLLKALYLVVPHLDKINISSEIVYDAPLPISATLIAGLYAVGYAGVLIVLGTMFFERREFN